MLSSKNQEQTPDVQFFVILDKIIDKPEHYLDLLELIYLCLSLGFEGKYKKEEHKKLKHIMETLFKTITKCKTYKPINLFQNLISNNIPVNNTNRSIWITASIVIITIIFLGSNYLLDKKATTLMHSSNHSILISE